MATQAPTFSAEQNYLICITCGNKVVYCAEGACSRCQTPAEVSRSVAQRGTPQHFLSVLGASGAGKTVFLGLLLDMLSRGHRELRGLPNGAFSTSVQQHTVSALEQRRFPDKTPAEADQWNWVHCEAHHVKKPKRCIDIITPDLAGEAIAMEMEHPATYPTIRSAVLNSRGVIVLFDSECVRDNGRSEDMFGIKLITYLCSLQAAHRSRRKKLTTPLAIVFTKSDRCGPAKQNPGQFAAANLPGTLQICKKSFANHGFFAASVVGSTATHVDSTGAPIHIPLHVEPYGIVEPLKWIMQSL